MLNYLRTTDAIIVITDNGESHTLPNSEELFEKVKKATSIDEVIHGDLSYEDDDITIQQEKNTSNVEIYFNGRYYQLCPELVAIILHCRKNCMDFNIRYFANFLKKVYSNMNVSPASLILRLVSSGCIFLPNGNVVIIKEYEDEKSRLYYKRRTFWDKDKIKHTYAIINPQFVEADMSFDRYIVLYNSIGVTEKLPVLLTKYKESDTKTRIFTEEENDELI